jgi:hypothetical protein
MSVIGILYIKHLQWRYIIIHFKIHLVYQKLQKDFKHQYLLYTPSLIIEINVNFHTFLCIEYQLQT